MTRNDVLDRVRDADPVDRARIDEWLRSEVPVALLEEIVSSDATIRPQRRRHVAAGRVALAAVCVITVVGLVVGILPSDESTPRATAAEVLRRAARAVAAEPPPVAGPGEFAYVRTRSEWSSQTGSDEPWAARYSETRETWTGTDGSGRIVAVDTGSEYYGPRDKQRCEDQLGPAECEDFLAPAGRWEERMGSGMDAGVYGTYEDLLDLPTDTDGLEAWMRKQAADAANPDYQMFVIVGDMLRQPLTPPELRSALYRVAARIPGVELVGEVKDPAGRLGTAVTLVSAGHVTPLPSPGEGDVRREIIFDPDTGTFLAERDVLVNPVAWADAEPGDVIGYSVYLEYAVVGSRSERPGGRA